MAVSEFIFVNDIARGNRAKRRFRHLRFDAGPEVKEKRRVCGAEAKAAMRVVVMAGR